MPSINIKSRESLENNYADNVKAFCFSAPQSGAAIQFKVQSVEVVDIIKCHLLFSY